MRSRTVTLLLGLGTGVTAAAAALASPLPRSAGLLLLGAAAAGAAWDRAGRARPPGWALTLVGAAAFLAALLPASRETLAEQSLTALAYLLAVKLLGPKVRRDHLQVLAVALVIVAGAASLEPDLRFAPLLAAILLLGIATLLWLPFAERTDRADAPLLRRVGLVGLGLAAASVPLGLGLFLLLPRAVNPFWLGLGGRARQARSGISDHLGLGEVSRVAVSTAVAFRADLEDERGPLPQIPYWRGTVLEVTDGRRWDAVPRPRAPAVQPAGRRVRVTYYVEPHGERQLFLLERPVAANVAARVQSLGANRVLTLGLPLARRIRYVGESVPGNGVPEPLRPEERALNLQLPRDLSPAIRALAAGLAAGAAAPEEAADRILAHFGSGFTYALEVPPAAGDPLEAFLLRDRTGYCEYFASALAVLLRAAGIPARVIGGYLGGQYVAAGNYYLVTQASAHAWVEAHLGERGWVRLDATPAPGELGTMAARRSPVPALWLDALRMRWNSWVIQYDAESQLQLARAGRSRLRAVRLDPRRALGPAAAALGAAALLALARALRPAVVRSPLERRARRFAAAAARAGAARGPTEGPLDHAERFARARPFAAAEIRAFARGWAGCVYGGRPADAATLAELDRLLDRIGAAGRAVPLAGPGSNP